MGCCSFYSSIINMEMEMEMDDLPRSVQHGLDISDPTPTSVCEAYRYLTKVNIQSQSHIQLDLTVPNNNSSTTKNGEGDDDHGMDVVITSSSRCWEDEVPTEILTKILSGIPIRRLIQYLCVSKTWFHTISHHMDPNLLLANQEPGIIVIHTSPGKSTRLSFNVRQEGVKPKSIDHAPFDILLSGHSRFESSCNGLICLKQYSSSFQTSYCDSSISSTSTTANYRILVCNPYLLEATTLPNIIYSSSSSSFPTKQQQQHHNERNPPFSFKENYGLGFSPSTNQYKVVRITWYDTGYGHMMKHVYRYRKNKEDGSIQEFTRRQPEKVKILTLGTNSWRIVSSVLPLPIYDPPVFANGSLHWKVDTRNASNYSRNICIISFDIGKEEFHIITQPPYVSRYDSNGNLDLIDWRGSLAMVKDCGKPKAFDIWVLHLNNNNKQQQWIREYTLQTDQVGRTKVLGLWKHGEILGYLKSSILISSDPDTGELLDFLKCPPTLISFDPKTNKKRQIHVRSGFESISTCEHELLGHTGSLVSLKAYGCKTWRTAPGMICSNLYNRDKALFSKEEGVHPTTVQLLTKL